MVICLQVILLKKITPSGSETGGIEKSHFVVSFSSVSLGIVLFLLVSMIMKKGVFMMLSVLKKRKILLLSC